MPILNKWTAAAGLIGVAAFLSLNATASGVTYTLEAPVPVCELDSSGQYKAKPCVLAGSSWLELSSLVESLKVGGVSARVQTSEGVSRATPIRGSEPTEVTELFLPGQSPVKLEVLKADGNDSSGYALGAFTKGKQKFVSTESLFRALGLAAVPLTVSSLVNPKVKVAGVTLDLGTPERPVNLNAALEGYIIARVFDQYSAVPTDAQGKPFVVPEMEGPFSGFPGGVSTTSSSLYSGNNRPASRKLALGRAQGQFFLLVSKPQILNAEREPIVVATLELLERQPGNVLISNSLPLQPDFVRTNAELRKGSFESVWLLAVNFEKPYDLLDTKNPVVLRSSDISY